MTDYELEGLNTYFMYDNPQGLKVDKDYICWMYSLKRKEPQLQKVQLRNVPKLKDNMLVQNQATASRSIKEFGGCWMKKLSMA